MHAPGFVLAFVPGRLDDGTTPGWRVYPGLLLGYEDDNRAAVVYRVPGCALQFYGDMPHVGRADFAQCCWCHWWEADRLRKLLSMHPNLTEVPQADLEALTSVPEVTCAACGRPVPVEKGFNVCDECCQAVNAATRARR